MAQLLTHIVQKSFGDDTINVLDPLQKRVAGECVNALFWRTLEGMENTRRIAPLPEGLDPIVDSFGRFWIDMQMLKNAGREPMNPEVAAPDALTVLVSDAGDWCMAFDPEAEDLDFNALVEHGFPLPERVAEKRYRIWDGQIIEGSMGEAGEEHFAGVRARLRELRAEHLVPAAGSVTAN